MQVAPRKAKIEKLVGRIATWLSRHDLLISLLIASSVGSALGLATDQLIDPNRLRTAPLAFVSSLLGLLILVSFLARNYSTDSGLCLVAWPSGSRFEDHKNIREAIEFDARRWESREYVVPVSIVQTAHWIDEIQSILSSIITSTLQAHVGTARLAIVPAMPDHAAFALGLKLHHLLVGAEATIWGRVASIGPERAAWGSVLAVDKGTWDTVFDGGARDIDGVGSMVHVVSARRIPRTERASALHPTRREMLDYVRSNSPGARLTEIDQYRVSESITNAAIAIRAMGRARLGNSPDSGLTIRLTCGEAPAFALGMLVAGMGVFNIEYFDKNSKGWKLWLETGEP